MVIRDDEEIPQGFIQIPFVDYHSASMNAVKYFVHKTTKKVECARTFEAIESFQSSKDYKSASKQQIDAYEKAHPVS